MIYPLSISQESSINIHHDSSRLIHNHNNVGKTMEKTNHLGMGYGIVLATLQDIWGVLLGLEREYIEIFHTYF